MGSTPWFWVPIPLWERRAGAAARCDLRCTAHELALCELLLRCVPTQAVLGWIHAWRRPRCGNHARSQEDVAQDARGVRESQHPIVRDVRRVLARRALGAEEEEIQEEDGVGQVDRLPGIVTQLRAVRVAAE